MTTEPDAEWIQEVREQVIDPMHQSAMVMTLYTGKVDWKIAMEMGAAVLLDKPIILCLSDETVPVPKHIAKIASAVLVFTDPDFKTKLTAALDEEVGS